MKLWEVDSAGAGDRGLLAIVEEYTVGDDYLVDQVLVPWDCYGSMAHAVMLGSIGVLTPIEVESVRGGLREVLQKHEAGEFVIARSDEDCHTAIENYLVARCGEVGKKVHTGRSRNDQVLTALKLHMKGELFDLAASLAALGEAFNDFAAANPAPMPGYTHLQKAMPSSMSVWGGSFAESIIDTVRCLEQTIEMIDSSPLGSAAGYGVSAPLDRELTARLLGFSRVQRNVMYCQNMRGRNEALVLGLLSHIALDLNKIAADLIFFAQGELGFIELPEEFCTGSSIMPQKRNPDVLELMRVKTKEVLALEAQTKLAVVDLPSGYNRDFQMTKRPLMRGFEIVQQSVEVMTHLIKKLKVDEARCRAACTPELFATDIAYEHVQRGMSFRDAYRLVKSEGAAGAPLDPEPYVAAKRSIGAPGNLCLDRAAAELRTVKGALVEKSAQFYEALQKLFP